jgi:serine/threonine protein kinase
LQIVDFERWKSLSAKPGIDSASVFDGGSIDSFNNYMDSHERRIMYIQANTFSFGVILLELISGRPPFSKETGYLADWVNISTQNLFRYVLYECVFTVFILMNAGHEIFGKSTRTKQLVRF